MLGINKKIILKKIDYYSDGLGKRRRPTNEFQERNNREG
jgi:hypothetical protein